jgi:transformation/transcription domain-associated protein
MPQVTFAPEDAASGAAVEGLAVVCDKHAAFLGSCAQLSVKELITPLREVAHLDAPMAYHLWVLMFTIVWGTLTKDEQETLAKSMINLLSREHHQKQQYQRLNVIQALMEGILFSEPQIKIPAELMKFLGKRYNVCHIAIPLLEHHLSRNLLKDVRGFHALADLYKHLSEEDMLAGLWRADEAILQWLPQNLYPKQPMERLRHTAASVCEETRAGMALVQHGFWPEAQVGLATPNPNTVL